MLDGGTPRSALIFMTEISGGNLSHHGIGEADAAFRGAKIGGDRTQITATVKFGGERYEFDLNVFYDITIPMRTDGVSGVRAFNLPRPAVAPVVAVNNIGGVEGGCHCELITASFHTAGTQRENARHINTNAEGVTAAFSRHSNFYMARLVSVQPERAQDGDLVISRDLIENALGTERPEALVLRTLPNGEWKLGNDYTETNPPYLSAEASAFLVECGVTQLLLDLPSADREHDNGLLRAHRIFLARQDASIIELIFVPDSVADGLYVVNLNAAAVDGDVTPCAPRLYPVTRR